MLGNIGFAADKTIIGKVDKAGIEQAKEKTKIILFDTDLINFTDDDFACGEADITEQSEDGLDGAGENTLQENTDCSDCPYFCPVCGECMYEEYCEE